MPRWSSLAWGCVSECRACVGGMGGGGKQQTYLPEAPDVAGYEAGDAEVWGVLGGWTARKWWGGGGGGGWRADRSVEGASR